MRLTGLTVCACRVTQGLVKGSSETLLSQPRASHLSSHLNPSNPGQAKQHLVGPRGGCSRAAAPSSTALAARPGFCQPLAAVCLKLLYKQDTAALSNLPWGWRRWSCCVDAAERAWQNNALTTPPGQVFPACHTSCCCLLLCPAQTFENCPMQPLEWCHRCEGHLLFYQQVWCFGEGCVREATQCFLAWLSCEPGGGYVC